MTGLTQLMTKLRRGFTELRAGFTDHIELGERRALRDRPWAEDYLHWACVAGEYQLHGQLVPPRGWRFYSVTHSGWCLAMGE